MALSLVTSAISARALQTAFTAADFSIAIQPEQASVQPGELMVFDGIIYNLSSQAATFGQNLSLFGVSSSPAIDGNNLFGSSYISNVGFPIYLSGTVAPGGDLQFPFMTVQTTPSIPIGSVVTSGPGNFLFQNIPRSTSDPYVDFFVSMTPGNVVVVPESGTFLLASLSFLVVWFHARTRTGAV